MKIFFAFLFSLALAMAQPAPPVLRQAFTTNNQTAAENAVRNAVPTNNPIFQGAAQFGGTIDVTGAGTFNNTLTASGGVFFLGNNPFQIANGAASGRVLTSDENGLSTWQNAPVAPTTEGGVYAMDDFSNYDVGQTNFALIGGFGWGTNYGVMDRGTNYSVLATNPWNRLPANKLRISRGGFTRRMPWGNDWSWIRMAILLRFPTNFIGTNDFSGMWYWGICNGTNGFPTNHTGVLATSLTNVPVWWGMYSGTAGTAATFQYRALANSSNTYILPNFVRLLNVTNNNYTTVSQSGGSVPVAGRDEGYFTWLWATFARTAATNAGWVTGISGSDATTFAATRPTIARAFNLLGSVTSATKSTVPVIPDLPTAGTETTYVIPAFYGELDSINFAWQTPGTNQIEIGGYAVMKLQ